MMPEMNGYDFDNQLRNDPELAVIPFVFLTAKTALPDVRFGKELGVDDYIKKPFESMDLISTVKGKLKRAKERRRVIAQEADRLKNDILFHLRHEIMTPLTTIQGWTDLLTCPEIEFTPDQLQEWLHMMRWACNRISKLMDDFTQLIYLQSDSGFFLYREHCESIPLLARVQTAIRTFGTAHPELTLRDIITSDTPACFGLPGFTG
ncbi:MAG: hybrid sensor histidine kinase/response regulator [Gemmatimonadetes bacterium]|nr:MAG: hybrid sensor histidine kinase/response regulator [Gemmatimonadota bacterium]